MPPSPDAGPDHPDYRFTLANERTLLAWLRTGLALVAGGVAVATYAPDLGVRWGSTAVALLLVLAGLGALGARAAAGPERASVSSRTYVGTLLWAFAGVMVGQRRRSRSAVAAAAAAAVVLLAAGIRKR